MSRDLRQVLIIFAAEINYLKQNSHHEEGIW